MRGHVVILSGPSGVGKDTIIDAWRQKNPLVQRVVAYTTRAPREGERSGIDYHFVTKDKFMEMADSGQFLEWKEVHGNCYATPLHDLERMVNNGIIAILKIDVQGALTAMKKLPNAVSIFLMPPSEKELEHRLEERGTDSEQQRQIRLENARWEMSQSDKYQHIVVNDDMLVKRAVDEIDEIVRTEMGA